MTYNISYKGAGKNGVDCLVEMFDRNETKVGAMQACTGVIDIANANLWWPYLMHSNPGYLYLFKVSTTVIWIKTSCNFATIPGF